LVPAEIQPDKEVAREECSQARVKLPGVPDRLVMQREEGLKILLNELRARSDFAVR
jgi:hypothetical protein